jgi:8-oxo-dGTP pyrophosphatase MutT (NUDIX family)
MADQKLVKGIDYIGVSVVYFCHDGQGNFIMAKRNGNARDEHGRFDIGGGAIEFDQTVEETIIKEIKEEYCADVLDYEFLGFRDVHREHQGKATHWVALDFKVLVDRDQVKNGEPHKFDEIKWFTLDNLPENYHSQFPNFLKLYKEKL